MTESPAAQSPAALYEVRGGVAVITLNRPDAMNAVNAALATAVGRHLEQAADDPDVRVVVLTGSGRAFCAGADLKEIAQGKSIAADDNPEWGFAGVAQHWIDKPVIAAVNGFAMGGGTELALACDLVVAADTAVFGLPEVKRGLIAAAGGVIRLQRQLPMKRALELALTGDGIEASVAREWGLVNRVVPADEVLDAALTLADSIAANAPLSVQYSKQAMYRMQSGASDWNQAWGAEEPWAVNGELGIKVFTSKDALEGPRAFAEKREPNWQGR
ncbi:crotonase/enoyl-CoA hydratase family protein [Gordonia shandongensis]|uniref:crotonase/enoyl-CoA hydratase family protein n=1 Tax=Gordonia shandongensis TaxID=376351 RepID=UPI000426A089|nr:crotonase/enoyl-CoA hydratase family protein [Gordonia shandongensis]